MPFFHRSLPLPPAETPPLDAGCAEDGTWHILFPSGELLRAAHGRIPLRTLTLDLSDLNPECSLALRVSSDGRYAAVAEEFGVRGRVFDLTSGRATFSLERDDYHAEFSAFALAFASNRGRNLLIHATDWNRLDITDVATGEVLSSRPSTDHADHKEEPEHYLDYFHGRLHISPDGETIAEDGWIWHPIGVPRAWSLTRWIEENLWESEDGPSLVQFPHRFYFWDGPMTWIDNRSLAIWGLGSDEEEMEPGIRIFNAATGEETRSFRGPEVAPQKSWPSGSGKRGWIAYDSFLYAVSPAEATVSVWVVDDTDTIACLHKEKGFVPLAHHRETQSFLSWRKGQVMESLFLTLG